MTHRTEWSDNLLARMAREMGLLWGEAKTASEADQQYIAETISMLRFRLKKHEAERRASGEALDEVVRDGRTLRLVDEEE